MKYVISIIALAAVTLISISASAQRTIVTVAGQALHSREMPPVYQIPLENAQPFLSYFVIWEAPVFRSLEIRFSSDAHSWTTWQRLEQDEHSPDLPISTRGSTAAEHRYFQLRGIPPDSSVQCHFYSPGSSEVITPSDSEVITWSDHLTGACPADLPPFFQRKDWCPNGTCREHPNPAYTDVTHLVIHHSAGENEADDWAAVVRAIWDFHVNGRGWSDIGYNWLIDPEGNIYQGRGNDVIGAHYCGANTGTMGVCLLGNFTHVRPTEAAIATLQDLLFWKVCALDLDPVGTSYHASSKKNVPVIIGHRDGCATACPGDLFYPQIPEVRSALADRLTTATRDITQGADHIRLFPNPAHEQLQVQLEDAPQGRYEVSMVNSLGKIVQRNRAFQYLPGQTPHTLRVADLPAGWYQVLIRQPDGKRLAMPVIIF